MQTVSPLSNELVTTLDIDVLGGQSYLVVVDRASADQRGDYVVYID